MNKGDLKPGDKIVTSLDRDDYDTYGLTEYFYDEYEETTLFGEVLDKKASRGMVWVRWDQERGVGYDRDDEEEVDTDLLCLESEISAIEKDFKKVQAEVRSKMEAAAELVREANQIVVDRRVAKNLSSFGAISPLVSAMDDSGWRSSSWGC